MAFAIAPAAPTQANSPTPFAPISLNTRSGVWIDLHFREMGDIREADVSREFRAEKRDFAESGDSPIADPNCPPCSIDVGSP